MGAEAEAALVAPGVLVDVQGMKSTPEACLEVAQEGVDPTEQRQVAGVFAAGDEALWWQPAAVTARKQARPLGRAHGFRASSGVWPGQRSRLN